MYMKIIKKIVTSLYITLFIFLFGCATNPKRAIMEDEIEFHEMSDVQHRLRAQELGIAYVDYLHLVNTKKNQVNKSQFKLTHTNNE